MRCTHPVAVEAFHEEGVQALALLNLAIKVCDEDSGLRVRVEGRGLGSQPERPAKVVGGRGGQGHSPQRGVAGCVSGRAHLLKEFPLHLQDFFRTGPVVGHVRHHTPAPSRRVSCQETCKRVRGSARRQTGEGRRGAEKLRLPATHARPAGQASRPTPCGVRPASVRRWEHRPRKAGRLHVPGVRATRAALPQPVPAAKGGCAAVASLGGRATRASAL